MRRGLSLVLSVVAAMLMLVGPVPAPDEKGEVTVKAKPVRWQMNLSDHATGAAPGKLEYEPFCPYREQEDFIFRWYEIDPRTGRFKFHRGLLGRPRVRDAAATCFPLPLPPFFSVCMVPISPKVFQSRTL